MAGEWLKTVYCNFPADYAEDRLRNLCDPESGIQTGPFGSQLHQRDYVAVGTPIITVEHIGENRILHEKVPCVSDADRDRLSRYLLRVGDIVFSRVGSVDRRALVRSAEDGWIFSGRCLRIRPDQRKIDSGYLSYFLGLPAFKEYIRSIAVGATMPSLNTLLLSDLVIPYPKHISEQRAIAHILGTLDDKIELNRRMSETFEAMARALFKSWFVDFDPVRAKAAVRREHSDWTNEQVSRAACPNLKPKIARLFPDSFENSELGEIPRGWEPRPLPAVIHVNPPRSITKGTLAPYLDMANMPTQGPSPDLWVMREVGSGMKFTNGDTLVARITPCLENGKTAYVDFLPDGDVGWGSTEYIVLRPKGEIPPLFAYLLARTEEFRTFAIHQMTGSSGRQRVPAASLEKYFIITPETNSPLFQHFGALASPMFDRIRKAAKESRTLAALRDALLPKLISGEIRVKDAEKFVEERGL